MKLFKNHKIDRLIDSLEAELVSARDKALSGHDIINFVKELNPDVFRALKACYEVSIEILKAENSKLKKDNNDLLDRLMSSYNPEALHTYKQVKAYENPSQPQKNSNPFDILDSLEAVTPEEKEQKAAAVSQIATIIGQSVG